MLAKRMLLLSILAVFSLSFALTPFAVAKKGEMNVIADGVCGETEEDQKTENRYNGASGGKDLPWGEVIATTPDEPEVEKPSLGDIVIDIDRPQVGFPDRIPTPVPELPYAEDVGVFVPYAVPLSIEEQKLVEKIAARFNVHEELVYGVMWAESRYDRNAVGRNGRYLGIMQISKSNLSILKKYCGVTNLMNFEQNVTAGCYYLGHYADLYDHNMNIMLLYYHGGYKYANPMIAQGIFEDRYTREVFAEMNRILEIRKQTAAEMGVRIKGWLYEY